jgi:rSAM/selenodomain-associated transferase 2
MTESCLSIIIPVLNEAEVLTETLEALQDYRRNGHEIIVVDGGSHDKTIAIALPLADKIIKTVPSRAVQMNEGAIKARHDILLFLHSDTVLPDGADALITRALHAPGKTWGRFNLRLTGKPFIFRVIETSINWRTAISGIATGDQGIFIKRDSFEQVGCYEPIPLMEDVALGKKLRKQSWPCCLSEKVLSSSRRWEEKGIMKTVLLMWRLRVAYFFGADPGRLVDAYYKKNNTI